MKLIITRTTLLNALLVVRPTTAQKVILPINEYAKLVAIDGKLTLSTTNMQESTVYTIDYDGEPFTMCLPVAWFCDFLKELTEQPVIIELTDGILKITATGDYEIATEPADDFPTIPTVSKTDFTINSAALKSALFATSEDELRPAFTGVILSDKCVRATDAYIVYSKSHGGYSGKSIIFPKRVLTYLPDEGLRVCINKNQVCFYNDTTQWHSLLIDEKAPPIDNIIPKDNPIVVSVDKQQLLSSLKRVKLFASHINQAVLTIDNNEIVVTSQNVTLAKVGKEVINCSLTGEAIKIGFEINNLIKVISNMVSDTIFIYLSKPNWAVLIRDKDEPDNYTDFSIIVPSALVTAV